MTGNRSNKNTIFYKLREAADNLPPQFRAGYEPSDQTYMFMSFPEQSAEINGEAGKQIGRGGRASIVVVDEAAHLPDSQAIYESLAATSPCVISLSSVDGTDNFFYELAHNPSSRISFSDGATSRPTAWKAGTRSNGHVGRGEI